MSQSLPPDYFERMFASDPDPWKFETSPYESEKFEQSIAALGKRRYERAFEVGCANGVLTGNLVPFCCALLSIDVSHTALAHARRRNLDFSHVDFRVMTFPKEAPDGQFDLMVLSEVLYYWSNADIEAAGAWISSHLAEGGDLLLVHWIGETDYPQTGDNAVRLLRAALPDIDVVNAHRAEKYRLDLWRIR